MATYELEPKAVAEYSLRIPQVNLPAMSQASSVLAAMGALLRALHIPCDDGVANPSDGSAILSLTANFLSWEQFMACNLRLMGAMGSSYLPPREVRITYGEQNTHYIQDARWLLAAACVAKRAPEQLFLGVTTPTETQVITVAWKGNDAQESSLDISVGSENPEEPAGEQQ